MVRKLVLITTWFPLAFAMLIFCLSFLSITARSFRTSAPLSAAPPEEGNFQIASSNGSGRILGASVISADARALLLESFLRGQGSPLAPFSDRIVERSDAKGLDFRLVVAIAMCESNAGKHMPKRNGYNAWGIGVYTGQLSGAGFDSWPHAIDWVTSYIKEKYYDQGLVDLKDIGARWAPPSVETGYSWTNCVESFQKSIL